ncbi:FecR family protein [Flagellimonas algicola]|uniref:FecR family protein n=1 Tax=Flagellimonas algicola TaxID=2583815 RepID=A0ABY2WP39_9FLAO|nr:FecR family protein [Allomuricauda algicola]TMU56525.1 FecR family protein [Allomuricauda algicola]
MSHSEKIIAALRQIQKNGQVNPEFNRSLNAEEKELLENLLQKGLVDESLKFLNQLDIDNDWGLVKKRLESIKPIRSINTSLLKYAAILIGLITATYFFFNANLNTAKDSNPADVITLKIGGEDVKVIDQGENQEIVASNGLVVGTQKGDILIYDQNDEIEELIYNELAVPYGQIFNLELSDGTIVHLNAGSSIKYPINFIKNHNREVFLNGEAYFKVAKDVEHPFIVSAGEVAVEVLGTEFNVSSYEEDSEINTVLVEGSVSMSNISESNESLILEPGFKGSFKKSDHSIAKTAVDLDLHTGWIKGELVFRKSEFNTMIKKIERRYNVSITNNREELNLKKFNARFHVDIESIHDVMQSISNVTPFDYTIEANENVIIY